MGGWQPRSLYKGLGCRCGCGQTRTYAARHLDVLCLPVPSLKSYVRRLRAEAAAEKAKEVNRSRNGVNHVI